MKESQSKILRNTLYKVYEWLSLEYRERVKFQEFYESEMTKTINNYKNNI